jgi:tRNA (pseudouridine54-N1)-methyltransferase
MYSRKGYTNGEFRTLLDAGRLDIVYQCILMSVFKSHSHRHDVLFHAFLNGPPNPPIHLEINGDELYNVRLDERTWEKIIKKVLSGGRHDGIKTSKESLQAFIKSRAEKGIDIFILEEKGQPIKDLDFSEKAIFVLGDHIGLPKNDEKFLLKYGKKVSLGKHRYLAASCVDIINYTLDQHVLKKYNIKR